MEPELKEFRLVGEVRAVDLNEDGGGTFRLRLEDGSEVTGEFDEFHQAVITRNFHNHRSNRLAIRGEGKFDASGNLCNIVRVRQYKVVGLNEDPFATVPQAPEENVLVRMAKTAEELHAKYPIPEEEKPPSDFAKNYKHYLYGRPKED